MTYATSNPPVKVAGMGPNGPQLWIYQDGDAHTDVDATDYFSNGDDLGMRVNDVVLVVDTATPTGTMHVVTAVTSGGAATVAAATLS